MKPSPQKNWQSERTKILDRICRCIKAREARGQSRLKSIRYFSRLWNGKAFKSDSKRHCSLHSSTLYRLYLIWLAGGENASVFKLNYAIQNRRIAAPLLVRFINFAAEHDFKSFRAAWESFCLRGGNFGPGRRKGQVLKLGYDSLWWNLPRGCFNQFKRTRRALRQAEDQIRDLRRKFTAEILARVPLKIISRQAKGFSK